MDAPDVLPVSERNEWAVTHDEVLETKFRSFEFQPYTNAEGRPYHLSRAFRLITNANLFERVIRYTFIRFLESRIRCDAQSRPPAGFIWHVRFDETNRSYDLYYANHNMNQYARVLDGPNYLRQVDESDRYLHFIRDFPMSTLYELNIDREANLVSSLSYGAAERVLNDRETVFPFTEQECQRLLDTYNHLKRGLADKDICKYPATKDIVDMTLVWLIATVGIEVEKNRKEYRWGTYDARTHRDLPDDRFMMTKKLRVFDILLTTMSFGMHVTYRKRLLSTRYKGKVHMPDFQKLIAGLLREWTDSNLLATVLVSANVAFLAVPDVLNLQKTASIASTIFGVVSILAGVHHNWRHRSHFDVEAEAHPRQGPNYDAADQYLRYLESRCGRELGVTIQAYFLALPVILLLWAVVTFLIAISAFGIQKAKISTRIVSISILGALAFVAILNIAYFWNIWYEKEPYLDDPEDEEEESKRGVFSKIQPSVAAAKKKVQSMNAKVVDLIRLHRPVRVKSEAADGIELGDLNT